MRDMFEQCNVLDESSKGMSQGDLLEATDQRSRSLEEDLKMIRVVGEKFMRKSTTGYLLLMSKRKKQFPKVVASGRVSVMSDSMDGDADRELEQAVACRSFQE